MGKPRTNGVGGSSLPNVRKISRTLFTPADKVAGPVSNKLKILFMQWGQFTDHDLTKTPAGMGTF